MKIIYIMGDGRSGSTILETMLGNDPDSVSVGECYRFWERFYKDETRCGCGRRITECELWSKVDLAMKAAMSDYNPQEVKMRLHRLLLFKNFDSINVQNNETKFFIRLAKIFYSAVKTISGKNIIIDSSKSPSWAKLISLVPDFDVRFIHLERSLPAVASSWKKDILLPEFVGRKAWMPRKSNLSVLRTWIRVKWLSSRLKNESYLFMRFEELCRDPDGHLRALYRFLGLTFPSEGVFRYCGNHGIAGNPVRLKSEGNVVISPSKNETSNISRFEVGLFRGIDVVANLIL